MKLNHKHLFWIFALAAALGFDLLFWKHPLGINFLIFIVLATLGGLIPIWMEKVKIPWTSYLLLAPISFFAGMTCIRAEPFTTALNLMLTVGCLILFSITLRNGAWAQYLLRDYLFNGFKFFLNTIIGGILFFLKTKKDTSPTEEKEPINAEKKVVEDSAGERQEKPAQRHGFQPIAPYLRGVLLALPVLMVLAFLLAQADPIFNDRLQTLLAQFRLENYREITWRIFYILVIAYLLLSAYSFGLLESEKNRPSDPKSPGIKRFLGTIEASMVLGGVNILFLIFVVLQFNYLFSGGKNISATGYTYAEYARRGFFELIVVGVISLVLFYILSMITKREHKRQKQIFSILGLILVGLVAIILVSAYTRLNLYELAYGFTRLRTLAHVFMIWLGLLLVSIAALEITNKMGRLGFILVCFIFGFGITLNVLNMDSFIARQNITRALAAADPADETNLDAGYLTSLSADAVPTLVEFYTNAETPDPLRDEIGGVLACRLADSDDSEGQSWVSYHHSRSLSDRLLQAIAMDLEQYPTYYDLYAWFVEVNGEVIPCREYENSPFD